MYLFLFTSLTITGCVLANSEPLSDPSLSGHRHCESLTIPFCKALGYNKTILPNLLNHNTQHIALSKSHYFSPAIKINCSKDLIILLCSIFFPPCTILEVPLPPCRSVCLTSKMGCEELLKSFGYDWPDYLDCSRFPEVQPCFGRPDSSASVSETSYSIDVSNPNNNIHGPVTGPVNRATNPIVTRDRFACPVHFMVPKGSDYIFRLNGKNYPDCGTPCDGLLFNKEERKLISGWILVLSVICLISTFFTFCTHLLEPRRFSYPEKALKFLSICYFVVALVFIIGFFFGDQIACNDPFPAPDDHPTANMIRTITQGNDKGPCTFTFMFLLFFGHSSYVWFTILSFTWFLTSSRKWGTEAIDKISGFFHVLAWAIPAFDMFRILAMKRIEGDPLSGVCFLDFWNREDHRLLVDSAFYFIYTFLSVLFLCSGLYSSYHVRQEFKAGGHDTYKLDNFMWRLTLYSFFYLFSTFTLIACNVYETFNMDSWMLYWQTNICQRPDSGIPCPFPSLDKMPQKPNLHFFMLKYAARLVPGIILSFHLYSKKTIYSWVNFNQRLWSKLCCMNRPIETEKSIT